MDLKAAAIAGNRDAVRSLLKRGIDVNAPDAQGRTPLSWAAEYGNDEVVQLLLERPEVDPKFLDNHRRGPLSRAAQHGQDTAVRRILVRLSQDGIMAECDSPDEFGRTPLSLAAGDDPGTQCKGSRKVQRATTARLLLERNANPRSADINDKTPLHWASLTGQELLVALYLKEGSNSNYTGDAPVSIDPNAKDSSGRTPLFLAIENQHRAIVQELLSHSRVNPNLKDNSGRTPLLAAIDFMDKSKTEELIRRFRLTGFVTDDHGRVEKLIPAEKEQARIVKLLSDRDDVDPNFQDKSGQTALSRAARSGNEHLMNTLLGNMRVHPDLKDNNGCTPLFLAAESGYPGAVKLLLNPEKNGGMVATNSQDNSGRTPLSSAVYNGHVDVVELLLGPGGADPDTLAGDGRTPLSLAAESGYEQIVKLLAQHGANPKLRDKYGRTPVDWVIERVFDWPEAMYDWDPDPFEKAQSIVSYLLKKGVRPDSKDNENRTSLQRAIGKGVDTIALLLLSEINFHNRTPLSWAAESGDEAVMKLLLKQNDTKVDFEDEGGRTALFRAAHAHNEPLVKLLAPQDNATLMILLEDGNEAAVRWMIDAGCEVNTTDPLGRTPLHVAVLNRQTGLLQDIIEAGANINAKDSDGKTPIRLAIEDQETEIVKLLLKFSAETVSIMTDQWSQAYKNVDPKADHAHTIHLSYGESEAEVPRFFSKGDVIEKPEVGNTQIRPIFMFASFSPWKSRWVPDIEWNWPHGPTESFAAAQKSNHLSSRAGLCSFSRSLVTIETKKDNQRWTTFTLVALTPTEGPTKNDKFLGGQVLETLAITWTMVPLRGSQKNRGWISVDHFSMLQNGWIPRDNVEFVTDFVSSLCQKWLRLCDRADNHLGRRRSNQLEEKGLNSKFINHLADDALAWAELRNMLRDQVHVLDTFASEHCRRYSNMRGLEDIKKEIRQYSEDIEARLDALDQTVRDLLQLEFAWVSIVEAHRSTSLSVSMKRLSWITLIFLPPMFASSLFSMNVDVLASNPDWRWYPVFSGAFLLVTLVGWLTFKSVEPRAERGLMQIGGKFNQRLGKGGTTTGGVSDIEMNSSRYD